MPQTFDGSLLESLTLSLAILALKQDHSISYLSLLAATVSGVFITMNNCLIAIAVADGVAACA